MCTPHFEIQNGVLAKCRMSGEEKVTVAIPDGVTSIGKDACWGCDALKSITIPDSVISIGDKVFAGCTALENITIPNSVINIGNYVFAGCNSLQSINVSEGNSNYLSCGGVLFDKSKSVLIKYPDGKKDTSYIIPDGVTSIGDGAFMYCESLQSITIPENVTSDEVTVTVKVNPIAMKMWALKYSRHIRVIFPQSFVDEIKADIDFAKKNYE